MKKVKKSVAVMVIALFAAVVAAPWVLHIALGDETVSEQEGGLNEKRDLADWPDKISNELFADIEDYFSDRAPFRNNLILFETKMSQAYETLYRKYMVPVLVGKDYLIPQTENDALYGRNDWLFYTGEGCLDDYLGTNPLTDAQMADRKQKYEQLQEICDAKGIKLVIMILPNKEQVYREYMPDYQITPGQNNLERFAEYMKANSSVNFVYPAEELEAAKGLFDVYYKQDTHWNDIGAYMGVSAFYAAIGKASQNIQEMEIIYQTYTGGDLSNMCGYATEYETYDVVYKPKVEFTAEIFLEGEYIVKGSSTAQTDQDIVVIGDSFRQGMMKYIQQDFANMTMAHMNYVNKDAVVQALESLGEGDVLLLTNVERYDAENVTLAEQVAAILQ